ncbi:adenosylmethionine--8-amino-7-oxononanoate transaminase [Paraconexibacter antarcticus]|uniref:Adenosylmethionine-8-amino-7-oxononanoate aminotransferase n=1 Tax=Paraconexibacter antarcticus TaxID=2949664 RepID=A0ABY5DTG9_9ACTN|nr:adenosylmethionine--8-amino-7-oxononanoate transaminase [Paraconexibacter antarcticus]UTI64017.1 adenosylmethionine--8-amino-7-oxononanoate transaminase [Paraconexibacter antarcticus]
MDWDALLAADRRHVWHPYGPMPGTVDALPVVSAEGVRLRLAGGRELIDGMSSWWCAVHGYRHPAIDAAIRDQLGRMAHVMFGGLTHEGAIVLAQRLVNMTPEGLEHVFFADSGSIAVEVAIKMALQAARADGSTSRTKLLTVRGGYHGDTFGAMAVCDPVGGMHSLFTGILAEHVFAPRPPDGFDAPLNPAWAAAVDDLAAQHAHELAAVIVEPVVQGAGGMRMHSPACVAHLRDVCDRHGLLLVLDEIATGFGRTGALFAAGHAGVTPDILCVGKALTGGALTLAATLCTPEVAARLATPAAGGALMHGPTYMANPLACAAALASTQLLLDGGWRSDVPRIEAGLRAGLAPAADLPNVADVRVLGAVGVVQLDGPVDMARVTAAAVERGVWLRPFRDLVYAMPPYVTGDADLARVCDAIVAAAAAMAEAPAPG